MAGTPRGGRAAAALRAAHAWTGLKDDEFADQIGISKRQLGRYKSGDTPVPYEVRDRVAHIAQVPRGFLNVGFGGEHSATVTPGVEELARRLDELAEELSALNEGLADQIATAVEQAVADELGPTAPGGHASAPDKPAADRQRRLKEGGGR